MPYSDYIFGICFVTVSLGVAAAILMFIEYLTH